MDLLLIVGLMFLGGATAFEISYLWPTELLELQFVAACVGGTAGAIIAYRSLHWWQTKFRPQRTRRKKRFEPLLHPKMSFAARLARLLRSTVDGPSGSKPQRQTVFSATSDLQAGRPPKSNAAIRRCLLSIRDNLDDRVQ